MKKTLLGFFSLASILFANPAFSENENGFILGLNLDKSIQAETTNIYDDDTGNKKTSFDSSSYSISAGYRTTSNNRFKVSYVKINEEHKRVDQKITGFDFDWQFVYGKSLVQPYWGIGFGSYSLEDSAKFNDGEDLSALSFQLMTGAKFDLNDHFELSAAYHMRTLVWEAFEYDNGSEEVSVISIDGISSLQVGANYKF